ncbi:MAG: type III pantothenate kinase [Massiliimalia sp.]|jgi:type III pantothenate kinase
MLFIVDIGNTNMEFGIYEKDQLKASFRLGTNRDITSDEVGLMMMQFFSFHQVQLSHIENVVITSVVPQVEYSVKNAMYKYLHKEPLVVNDNLKMRIVNKYAHPTEVGADRLVNAYAAYRKYGGNLIVVDFGTATTFDVIDGEGAYLGGAIYPGIKISLDALVEKTSKLPKVQIEAPEYVIGKNTVMSMQSGLVYGYTGAVVNIVRKIEEELGVKTKVIATGGLARMIGRQTDVFTCIDKTLTLEGLAMIYRDAVKDGLVNTES